MNRNNHITIFIILIIFIFASCGSAPDNPGDIVVVRSQAESWLDSGIREAGRGNFTTAHSLITESKRSAILTDDSSLMIRSSLSLGNVLFSLGRIDEAFAQWDEALAEAERSRDSELISLSKIFIARGNLSAERASAQSVLDEVIDLSGNIGRDRLYIAFSWQARGLALRALGQWSEAEDAFRRSLDIHVRDRQLENASYDWFVIASIRSLAGNTEGALRALEESIALDRRIENSWGLAASYRAMGDVYRKAGRNDEAMQAYNRARAIYAAMGNNDEVLETERRMRNNE